MEGTITQAQSLDEKGNVVTTTTQITEITESKEDLQRSLDRVCASIALATIEKEKLEVSLAL